MSLRAVCSHCSKIKIDCSRANNNIVTIEFGRHDHYPEFPALTKSAQDGCAICGLFKEGIRARFQREQPKLKPGVLVWDSDFTIARLSVFLENGILNKGKRVDESVNGPFRLILNIEAPHIRLCRVPFDIFAEKGSAAAQGKIQRRLPSLDASSDASIGLIKGWLHECDEHHEDCRRSKSPKLPTRVIDVSHEVPRLIITTKDNSGEYIALSHCWGNPKTSGPPLTTETKTLESRLQGIGMHELPQNFQDAINITTKLGLCYIWIDSLCIIQDSAEDWMAEAARMMDVYKGSYLTIPATSAISSHDGFLKRSSRTQQPVKVPCYYNENTNSDEYFYLYPTDMHWAQNSFDEYIEGSVWNQRGWTFQERLLPIRVLHFAKDMFYLECRSRDHSEDNRPAFIEGNRTPWLQSNETKLQLPENTRLKPLPKKNLLYSTWYELVGRYATREFTYAKDKLPAIAGLAREMTGFVDDIYMFGLWKGDLCRGLMWDTINDYDDVKLQTNRAPSWSWGRFDGRIYWNTTYYEN